MATKKELINDAGKYLLSVYRYPDYVLEKGSGMYLYDTDGKKYTDFVAGIAVNILGHGDKGVVKAVCDQAKKMIHCSNLYLAEPPVTLARMLVKHSFADRVFFCNSGTEATEGAIKFARKWGREAFRKPKSEIITATGSFHGRTLGSLAATGQKAYQDAFKPMVPGFKYVAFNDYDAVAQAVTEKTCAIMVEPVQGEGGIQPASRDYLKKLRQLCNDRGILLIFDEIQCGLGRIGPVMAYQYFRVKPDILTLAKPLGGGLPIGAVLLKDNIAQYLEPGDHGSTFGGNPVACAAAVEVLNRLYEGTLLRQAREAGTHLFDGLNALKKKYPCIVDVRGIGLMAGIEFSFDAGPVISACAEQGYLVCKAGANVLRMVPPLIVEKQHIDGLLGVLDGILAETCKEDGCGSGKEDK